MPTTNQLGSLLTHQGQSWRVVRVVKSETLFQLPEGPPYIIDESYIEIRSFSGDIDHILLSPVKKLPYEGPYSGIKGLPPIPFLERQLKETPDEL